MANRRKRTKRTKRPVYFDYNLLAVVIILICFGLVMLYSASSYEATAKFNGDDMYYFRHQALISACAVVLAVFVAFIDYHILMKYSFLLYILSLVLMAMVRYTSLGVSAYGSRRWLKIGIQFQPSEVAKIAIILFMTYMIVRVGRNISTKRGIATLFLIGLLQALAAYFWTDNLSTALIILGISVVMIFLAHPETRIFIIILVIIVVLVLIALYFVQQNLDSSSSFRVRRVLAWLNPEDYLSSGGYQVMQGLYAIGSGGLFGKGLGNSTQKLSTIPEAQNDMIFTIICEELGLFGAILLLLLFGYLLYRLFFIAQNAPDLAGTLIASGVFVHIALQVILNICVVLNVIPTTGVTLPFVSYGGTSVLFLMTEIGLALSVSRRITFQEEMSVQKSRRKVLTNRR